MCIPLLLGLLVFVVAPFALAAGFSVTDMRLISPLPTKFVGLANYAEIASMRVLLIDPKRNPDGTPVRTKTGQLVFPSDHEVLGSDAVIYGPLANITLGDERLSVYARDADFWKSLANTVIFVVTIVIIQGSLGLLLALLVNEKMRGVALFRAAYFSPVVTPLVISTTVWGVIYSPDNGLLNHLLPAITFGAIAPQHWLVSPSTALISILIVSVWQSVGVQMVIFLAGLQQIPDTLLDAAKVDGANALQRFRYVTLPGLRNSIVLVIVTLTIFSFRLFTPINVLTQGGPQDASSTLFYYAFKTGYRELRVGYASAIIVVLLVLVIGAVVALRTFLRSEEVQLA